MNGNKNQGSQSYMSLVFKTGHLRPACNPDIDSLRWRPKSKMAARIKGNVIYLAVKIGNETNEVSIQVFPGSLKQMLVMACCSGHPFPRWRPI